jgi:nicotinate-nucleotide pyrophosphorylase (carboxylating)
LRKGADLVTDTPTLDAVWLAHFIEQILEEDLGQAGDVTSVAVVPEERTATAHLVARGNLVLAGIDVAGQLYHRLEPKLGFEALAVDGSECVANSCIARVHGSARSILAGERAALNLLMRMSGIATATRAAVREIEGTGAVLLDTRKTAPGLRRLDKYAVAAGGGTNHRAGLHDAVMIKDTHLEVVQSISAAVTQILDEGHPPERITVEVRNLDQLGEAIESGAGRALLDNMSNELLRQAVRLNSGRIVLEASGGLRLGALRAVAETGIDCLSVGWLTHSAPSADLAMEMVPR